MDWKIQHDALYEIAGSITRDSVSSCGVEEVFYMKDVIGAEETR